MAGGIRLQMFPATMNKLENILSQLNIEQQGQKVDSHEAWAIVGFWHGDNWKRIESAWINGVISDDDFFDEAIMLINQFADKHQLKRPKVA